jgi:hypothetical protein
MVVTMRMPVAVVMAMGMRTMLMSVVPKFRLIEQEEKHQADEQSHKQIMRAGLAFKSFGQQMHERGRQQSTGRHAQHVLGVARHQTKTEDRSHPHAAYARAQGSDQYGKNNHRRSFGATIVQQAKRGSV